MPASPANTKTLVTNARRSAFPWLLVIILSVISAPLCAAISGVHHKLNVDIKPEDGSLRVAYRLTFPTPVQQLEFTLNTGFDVESSSGAVERRGDSADGLRSRYALTLETANRVVELQYHGQPGFSERRGHGGMPQGAISARGVYLDGASAWYPLLDADIGGIDIAVGLPGGWRSVSVGRRSDDGDRERWRSDRPHDDLYLIADRFSRHARRHGDIDLSVYLIDDDPELAGRYLDAVGGFIDHYSRLIGPYPYGKFAVVENRWQTGYGMPSFTLLGSRVMRLPFILYSSLPHEILHNWWGNGVWIDYQRGNWSEGLTAYLADHWMQEQRGRGAHYRLKALQRYSNYAARGPDAPLLAFTSRHNEATQSIGYSKSLMVFHMLRSALGDARFVDGLRRLWREHAFERVGFATVVRQLAADDAALGARFARWLESTGAPRLTLENAAVAPAGDGWTLNLTLRQRQAERYPLTLPVAVALQDQAFAERRMLSLSGAEQTFELRFPSRPLRVDIDPEFDVLRVLDITEQPPALNRLYGSQRTWLVLPDAADAAERAAWRDLADAWTKRYPGMSVIRDSEAQRIAPDDDRLILGWRNALLGPHLPRFARDGQELTAGALRVADDRYSAADAAVVVVANDRGGVSSGFIGAPAAATIRQLARKLPHYGSYGRLVFDPGGNNLRKDALAARHSLLSRQLGDGRVDLRLAPRPALDAPGAGYPADGLSMTGRD
ncbi:MAG: M1 family aminopeptidase [Gammaproteobacteria bacterium]|nr:M1 family aminopeptidase [Gammaproteobacteria bacterium]